MKKRLNGANPRCVVHQILRVLIIIQLSMLMVIWKCFIGISNSYAKMILYQLKTRKYFVRAKFHLRISSN